MKGLILFLIAAILSIVFIPIGIIYSLITLKFRIGQYFFSIAVAIDQMGNVIMQDLFNFILIKKYYTIKEIDYHGFNIALFGNEDETISSVLGKNKQQDTLTFLGKALNWILNIFEKNHSIKAIESDEN